MARIYALIAQLDRVQVSEACGVGSSPAERTSFYTFLFQFLNRSIFNTVKPTFLLGLFVYIAQNTHSI